MTISPGDKLGAYEIASLRGAGGQGEVYKATDTRLGRTVALKVLPSHLAGNPLLKERFEREHTWISIFCGSYPNIFPPITS